MTPKINDPSQEPFIRYNLKKKADTISVKLNTQERAHLERMKAIIEQPKDSTALKQLALIGAKVILSESGRYMIRTLFKNRAKNQRSGIHDFD